MGRTQEVHDETEFATVTQTWKQLAKAVLNDGWLCQPRGLTCREILGSYTLLNNPRARIPLLPVRRWSLAYACGELAWYLGAKQDLELMKYYAPQYEKFSDDGATLYGAYGPRIFGESYDDSRSPWRWCVELLKKDRDTRQAVIPIYRPPDVSHGTKDKPCTLTLQFLLREDELHMIVNMRSNDLWLGTLYDVFCFTAMQELMAAELDVPVGSYLHQAGSMHLYEKDWEPTQRVLNDKSVMTATMESAVSYCEWPTAEMSALDAVKQFTVSETLIRQWPLKDVEATVLSFCQDGNASSLLDLARAAWSWKRLKSDATFDEGARRTVEALLRNKLGVIFERCFF